MTDAELIARLRDEHVAASRTEAADRIEALIAERDALQAWKRYWSGEYDTVLAGRADEYDRAEAAEAKLAKAVEALGRIARQPDYRLPSPQGIAQEALAELKGDGHE